MLQPDCENGRTVQESYVWRECLSIWSSDSSVGIETRLWGGRSKVQAPARGKTFSHLNNSRQALRPTRLPILQWVPWFFTGSKMAGAWIWLISIVSSLRMSGAKLLFLLYTFKAWTGITLPYCRMVKSVFFVPMQCLIWIYSFVRNFCFVYSDEICLWLVRLTAVNKSEFTALAECHLMYGSKFTSVRTWMSCSKPASVVMGCLYAAIKKAPVVCCLEQSQYCSDGEVA